MKAAATLSASEELSILDLHAPFSQGIEASASILEIRLALQFYWRHHDRDHWKLYLLPSGRA